MRHTPYFQRIGRSAFLGFRRGPDTWSARYRSQDGNQTYKFLGGPLEFDEAKRQAEAWLAQLVGSAVRSIKRATVREALEAYLTDLRRDSRPDTAFAAEGKFRTVVCEDAVAHLNLEIVVERGKARIVLLRRAQDGGVVEKVQEAGITTSRGTIQLFRVSLAHCEA